MGEKEHLPLIKGIGELLESMWVNLLEWGKHVPLNRVNQNLMFVLTLSLMDIGGIRI